MASFFGRWPYRCRECGSDFLLRKRYVRLKQDPVPAHGEPDQREVSTMQAKA
ncbi:MAG TPA: hypothetical protein VHB50_07390 [Bryobacteraceae bacterium]|nr:hypothetical protein [Bryobacteraceae bacterium]